MTTKSSSRLRKPSIGQPLISGRYKVVKPIGSGSFGDIYQGIDMQDGGNIAIKIESYDAKFPQLMYEAKVYEQLGHKAGIANLLYHGSEKYYNAMVMELLGPSLEDLFNKCDRRFSQKTILMIADQMLAHVEYIHEQSFIHRDIKPDNFLIGTGKHSSRLYMIDFGLAKRYRNKSNGIHIVYRSDRNLTGTVRYASINAQMGIEQSRRDDLESLGYCLMYFNTGKLPWQGFSGNTKKQKYERILEMKKQTTVEQLCHGYPDQYALFLKYSRNLQFTDTPDYAFVRQLFRILFSLQKHQFDYNYDWTVVPSHHRHLRSSHHNANPIPNPNQTQNKSQEQGNQRSVAIGKF